MFIRGEWAVNWKTSVSVRIVTSSFNFLSHFGWRMTGEFSILESSAHPHLPHLTQFLCLLGETKLLWNYFTTFSFEPYSGLGMSWLHLGLISHATFPCPVVEKMMPVNTDSKKLCIKEQVWGASISTDQGKPIGAEIKTRIITSSVKHMVRFNQYGLSKKKKRIILSKCVRQ